MNQQLLLTTCLMASVATATTPPPPSTITCGPGEYVSYFRVSAYRRRRSGRTVSRVQCHACPPGQHMNLHLHSQTDCYKCQPPQWQDLPGATSCKPSPNLPTVCPVGKWGLVAATMPGTPCHACSPGKYQSNPGQGMCHQCSAGTYQSDQGTTSCLKAAGVCPAGRYGRVGSTTMDQAKVCSPCEVDTYQPHPGQDSCRTCDKGYHQPLTGQSSCVKIPRCARYYYWNHAELQCVVRHPHLVWVVIPSWTCWALTIIYLCCGNVKGPFAGGVIIYNFVVCLGIGIESTRMGGHLSDARFWTMVGFVSISVLSWIYVLGCLVAASDAVGSCLVAVTGAVTSASNAVTKESELAQV